MSMCAVSGSLNNPKTKSTTVREKKKRLKKGAQGPTRNLPQEPKQSDQEKMYQKKKQKPLVEGLLSSNEQSQEDDVPEQPEIAIKNIQNSENDQNLPYSSLGAQTEFALECSRELEMSTLKRSNLILNHQIRILMNKLEEAETATKSISRIFTKGQIKRLTNTQRKSQWSTEDYSSAISLYTAGPRAYKILCKRNYPLPSAQALKKWTTKLQLSPGILDSIINLLSNSDYDQNERFCVMTFDQIEVKAENINDAVSTPFKYAQVIMIRGLLQEWKHIIYYNFDYAINASILTEIIRKLMEIDFKVVAIVTGLGPERVILWKELQITEDNPYFVVEYEKVFFFVDVPRIIKLIRRHFLDTGFILNKKNIDVSPLKRLLKLKTDLELCNKLTQDHINIKKPCCQKVKFSAQIFSNSVSKDLRKCAMLNKIRSENVPECCDFFKLVNDWFDVFNSKSCTQDNTTMAYGLALKDQNKIISSMTDKIKNLRVAGKETLRPFQKGILLNNSALPKLFKYLQDKYSVKSIFTNRLNQDELKQVLGLVNTKEGLQYNPTPLEFTQRLKSAILSNLIN